MRICGHGFRERIRISAYFKPTSFAPKLASFPLSDGNPKVGGKTEATGRSPLAFRVCESSPKDWARRDCRGKGHSFPSKCLYDYWRVSPVS